MNTEMLNNFSCPKSSDMHDQPGQGEGRENIQKIHVSRETTFSKSEKHSFFLWKEIPIQKLHGAKHYHPKAKCDTERSVKNMLSHKNCL